MSKVTKPPEKSGKADYLSAFTKKLTVDEITAALQLLNCKLRNERNARSEYYARRGSLGKIRTEVEPLAAYVREIHSNKGIFTLWDEGDEIYDARLYKDENDPNPIEYVQLTLTMRVANQARQDRLLSKSLEAAPNSLEKQKFAELNLQEQIKQPDFILDTQTGLYQYLIDIAIALVKKTNADYSEGARSVIVIGIDLPPLFFEMLETQGEVLQHIAWSLSHINSGVDDVYIVTWPERFAISVNEAKNKYEFDFRFSQEQFPNSNSTTLPRQNQSGFVCKAGTLIICVLNDITSHFFSSETNSVPRTSSNDEMSYIAIEWAIPILDTQNKISTKIAPAFRITFSKDFCEVIAGRGFARKDLDTISAHIQHFILRYMTQQIQGKVENVKTLVFGSSYFD